MTDTTLTHVRASCSLLVLYADLLERRPELAQPEANHADLLAVIDEAIEHLQAWRAALTSREPAP